MNRTILLRDLAMRVASHPRIQQAVANAIREEMPDVAEIILSEMYPGEHVQFYSVKKPVNRRERDLAIRTEYNGHNAKALAKKYGISPRMVFNIIRLR